MPFNQTTDAYASEGFLGYGAGLFVGDGNSPETFYLVAEVLKITPGAQSTAVVERTHLQSPEAHKEKLPGIRDTEPFGLEGNWRPDHVSQSNNAGTGSPSSGGGLLYLARTRAIKNFKIKLANDIEWPFSGFVSKFQPGEISTENVVKFTAEVTPVRDTSAALP